MNEQASVYLQQLNNYLKKMDQQERMDILEEVESHIFEAVSNGAEIDIVLKTLGSPKALADSYIDEAFLKEGSFNLSNLMKLIKFYFVTGFSGMFIVSCVGIISITFYFCSFIVVAAGVIKMIGLFFGYSLPIVVMNFGFWQAPDFMALPVCLLVGLLLYISSKKMWNWLKGYLLSISVAHRKLKNSN
ncbi:DUF1700 domain-containing protein [Enterococcus sp. BWB1-3]|nr:MULTISPECIES: DUF1700 domain-containing protein [unclassified Enterococcus]MBL1229385.1 DUF1700 domain-containing protein [Enterococcus sp. BWB1-3]MCB5951308.1 DUF1700 domain-containing protein [Enterococcus sp. BWT-B8]MCB5956086.1 DUF1700 domain-containing protein [Enterococcus sp. CWB-B31]